ncbi:ISL3 family transposase, partial [Bowdeniella nasicola]
MPHPTCPCTASLDRCSRCDVLLGLPGLHLTDAEVTDTAVVLDIETCDPLTGCPGCGVIPTGHGRITVTLIDAPSTGRPAR